MSEQDLVRFRAEVLGIPPRSGTGAADKAPDAADEDDELTELNLAFSSASMSMSSNTSSSSTSNTGPSPSPNANSGAGAGPFTNFYDHNNNSNSFNSPVPAMTGLSRQSPSPGTPSAPNGGMGPMNVGMPVNAGHQMDLNHLYEMVLELSDVLKNNRDMTKGIIDSAEEIMVGNPAPFFLHLQWVCLRQRNKEKPG